jgi:hypothetical protein
MAVDAVGLETEPTDEEEKRARYVVPLGKFATLATVAPMEEVLANAEPVAPPKPQQSSQRPSRTARSDGGPSSTTTNPRILVYRTKGRSATRRPRSFETIWSW